MWVVYEVVRGRNNWDLSCASVAMCQYLSDCFCWRLICSSSQGAMLFLLSQGRTGRPTVRGLWHSNLALNLVLGQTLRGQLALILLVQLVRSILQRWEEHCRLPELSKCDKLKMADFVLQHERYQIGPWDNGNTNKITNLVQLLKASQRCSYIFSPLKLVHYGGFIII